MSVIMLWQSFYWTRFLADSGEYAPDIPFSDKNTCLYIEFYTTYLYNIKYRIHFPKMERHLRCRRVIE